MAPQKSYLDILKKYDAYPKTIDEFKIKTLPGATITIIACVIMCLLFLSEISDYLTPKIKEELFVDTSRGNKLKINLDFIFPSIPCDLLSLDAMDVSGEQHVNIQHNLYKRRLDLEGNALQDPERQKEIGHGKKAFLDTVSNSTINNTVTTDKPECGSCYGAEYGEIKCCNTCDEVKEGYRRKGWALPPLGNLDQCKKEGILTESKEMPKEGCQLFGYLEVNRVGGNFHIAPGKSYQHHRLHVHDVLQYRTTDFDLSHRIRHLSFGSRPLEMQNNPLDNYTHQTEKGARSVTYYLKVVPSAYERRDGSLITSNQFSVTQNEKKIDMLMGDGLPGVFFSYELSPLMVKYTEQTKSFGHLATGLCAIIGGVFTVAGLLDAFIYHSARALQQKIELGKAT